MSTDAPHSSPNKLLATVVFGVGVGGVLALFLFLGAQSKPPALPAGAQHRLRFNLNGELIGVAADPPVDPVAASAQGFAYDLKAVEARVNAGCQQCHGAPQQDLRTHACAAGSGPCIPAHHPPKNECIKCHRAAAR